MVVVLTYVIGQIPAENTTTYFQKKQVCAKAIYLTGCKAYDIVANSIGQKPIFFQ